MDTVLSTENEFDLRISQNIFAESGLEAKEKREEQQDNEIPEAKKKRRPDPINDPVFHGIEAANFECQFCGESVTGLNRLDSHLRKVHMAKISYTCHICQLKIWRVNLLKRHLRTHERDQEKVKSGQQQSKNKNSKRKRTPKKPNAQDKSASKANVSNDEDHETEEANNSQNEIPSPQKINQIVISPVLVPSQDNEIPSWTDFPDDGGPDHADDDWGWDTDFDAENRLSDISWLSNVPAVVNRQPSLVPTAVLHSTSNVPEEDDSTEYPCAKCTEVFSSKRYHDIHVLGYHNLKVTVNPQCSKCRKKFDSVESYKVHVKFSHRRLLRGKFNRFVTNVRARRSKNRRKKRNLPCGECGHLVRNESELKIHMQRHTGVKLFSCDDCGADFAAPASLKRHQRAHLVALLQQDMEPESPTSNHEEEEIVVPAEEEMEQTIEVPRVTENGRMLRTLQKVRYDLDLISPHALVQNKYTPRKKNVKCPHCDHVSRSQSELLIHLQTHTGIKMFKCHSCDKNCATKNSLIRHIQLAHADIKPHPCSHCSKTYSSLVDLRNHQRYHAMGKNYKCTFDQCDKRFALKNHLLDHMRRHTGERPFQCQEEGCGRAFMSSTELRRHNKSHALWKNGELPIPSKSTMFLYSCNKCSRRFSTLDSFQRHQKVHDPNRKSYLCDLCGKKYFTKSALVYHSITHEEEQNIPCTLCPKKFQTQHSLELHEKIYHERNRRSTVLGNTICEVCGKTLKSSSGLKSHMERHTEQKKYICEQCGKGCATAGDLKFHMYTHQAVKPFKCDFCEYRCTHPSNINHHVAQDHMGPDGVFKEINVEGKEKSFICFTCGEGWTNEKSLEHHQLYHTGKKDIPCKKCAECFVTKYDYWIHAKQHRSSTATSSCTVCGRVFNSKPSLESHMRYKHTGETPFACTSCDRKFKSRQDLRYHSYSHTGNYPFACSVCGKRAGSRGNLNAHMRTHQRANSGISKPQVHIRCPECDQTFSSRNLLKKHMSTHNQTPENVVDNNLTETEQSMSNHMEVSGVNNHDSSSLSSQVQDIQTVSIDPRVQPQPTTGFQINYSQFFTANW